MAKNQGRKPVAAATTEATSEVKPKRKMLTPAEKVARLEAELEAARKKAEEKAGQASKKLREQRAKLVTKRDEIDEKIKSIDTQLVELGGDDTQVDELPLESSEG